MATPNLPLNALRAFEAAARRQSFTRAAEELCVTQAAVSHQVKGLEARLGVTLFRRSPRGLVLTDEGVALAPALTEAFERIGRLVEQVGSGKPRETVTLSAVGTFAAGWLLSRLAAFRADHPRVDLRLLTNNNKVDLAAEGLDFAIRYGDGAWQGVEAELIMDAPLATLCTPQQAARLRTPQDVLGAPLLRSYRPQDWQGWFQTAGLGEPTISGALFDSSWVMIQAALLGEGVALAPPKMFARELASRQLVQPFDIEVNAGGYWLTRLKSRRPSEAMEVFRRWILECARA
jgi:LysR family transcriptional regulator of beta-lactamase